MISKDELIQDEEYWEEIVSNSLWRVSCEKSSVINETIFLVSEITNLIKVLKEASSKTPSVIKNENQKEVCKCKYHNYIHKIDGVWRCDSCGLIYNKPF